MATIRISAFNSSKVPSPLMIRKWIDDWQHAFPGSNFVQQPGPDSATILITVALAAAALSPAVETTIKEDFPDESGNDMLVVSIN